MGFSVAQCQPPALQRSVASDLPVSKGKPTLGQTLACVWSHPEGRITVPARLAHAAGRFYVQKGKGPSLQNTDLVFLRLALHSQVSHSKKRELEYVHPQNEDKLWVPPLAGGALVWVGPSVRIQGGQRVCLFCNDRGRKNSLGWLCGGVKHYPSQMTVKPFKWRNSTPHFTPLLLRTLPRTVQTLGRFVSTAF